MKITKYLDPTNPGGGGAAFGEAFNLFGEDKEESGNAGAGSQGEADQLAKDNAVFEALSIKDVASLTNDEKATLADLTKKYDTQAIDADGKAIDANDKKAEEDNQKKLDAIKAKPALQRTVEELNFLKDNDKQKLSVYEQVDTISGIAVAVDYGDASPDSPEGILKREDVIRDQAASNYDAQLKNDYPLAYNFLLHLQAGGSPTEFLNTNTDDFNAINFTKDDKGTQEAFYRRALALKGNTSDQVDAIVQYAKDKGKLYEQSSVELSNLQKQQNKDEQDREVQAKKVKQQEIQLVNNYNTQVKTALEKGISGVLIPLTERKEFASFVDSTTYVRDGKLISYKVLDASNLNEELAASYFKFKKGDLSKVVANKAASLNADKIRTAAKTRLVMKANTGADKKEYVGMKDI